MKAPKLRFINFKDELQEKKLGSIVDIFRGASPRPKSDPRFYGGPIPRLMIEDVTRDGKYVTPKVDSLTLEGAKKSRLLSKGALVLSCSGTRVAIPGILNVDACIHDGFFGFKNFKELDKDYLFYFFEKLHESIQASATKGATFNNLTTEIMKTMTFILPSLLEQKKIASFFSTLDKKIQLQQQKIDLLQEQKKGFLQKMFPKAGETQPEMRFDGFTAEWKKGNLGELMKVTSVKRIHQSDWKTCGVRFLRARDIVSAFKGEKTTDHLYISREKYEEYSKTSGKVTLGDLLVTGVGSIGVPLLITNEEPVYFKDGNVIWFKNNNKLDGNFFYYSFIGSSIQKFIKDVAGVGTVGTYTIESGRKTPIILPTKEEQVKIGNFLEKLDNVINLQKRKLELLQKQKKGFMQQMFI